MRTLVRLAALGCAVAALAACDPVEAERKSVDASRYFAQKVMGTDYDLRLLPAPASGSTTGSGPLVVTRTRLTFADGYQIPLAQIAPGLYRTPSLRTRYGAQGSPICGGRPISYVALHQGPGDLYYLNAGDWRTAPPVPARDAERVPGACQTAAYRLGTN